MKPNSLTGQMNSYCIYSCFNNQFAFEKDPARVETSDHLLLSAFILQVPVVGKQFVTASVVNVYSIHSLLQEDEIFFKLSGQILDRGG